ncbi:MAG TPA: acetyl-CoA carboxylase biotin carboxyl carrier protein subunit [Acidobacteriota bacterium]|nr:acetyl-CoA carboxylase biotin carboxyl carrier protein subunit [Acidobacteriota bacterium]
MSDQEELSKIALENGVFETRVTKKFLRRKSYEKKDPRVIKALIPGVVAAVETTVGKAVKQGDTLLILEAMKMLNRIKAPVNGAVKALRVAAGDKVVKGQVLIEIE